jgi:hypothetical protein
MKMVNQASGQRYDLVITTLECGLHARAIYKILQHISLLACQYVRYANLAFLINSTREMEDVHVVTYQLNY